LSKLEIGPENELEKIEQNIKELEAIKYYDQLKTERDKLAARVEELEQEASRLKRRVKKEKDAKEKLEGQLKSKMNELENLKSRVEKLELEASTLRETSKLIGKEKLTLPQLTKLVAKVKSEEIEKLFKEYRSRWEAEKKPLEVYAEACKALTQIITTLKGPEPHHFQKELLNLGLPNKIKEIVLFEVKSGFNEEFQRRVDEESNRKASEKLNQLERIEWPSWYAATVEPRIAQLEDLARINALNLLKGVWTVTCDKCGQIFKTELKTEGLDVLLRAGYVYVECQNPNCKDSFLKLTWRHKFRASLKDLVEMRILT